MKSLVALALLFAAANASAQDTTVPRAAEAAIERARQLTNAGRDSDGRKIIDSLMRASKPDMPVYAEALYWRAALAGTAADAERDYRRLLIETPMSPRAEDATLQLANLLQARGDRRGASDYLQRFLLTYANSPARPRVALSLVRLLFDQGPQQQARACEAFRLGRETITTDNVELRNQLDFYAPRCVNAVAEAPAAASAPAPAPAAPTPVAPAESASARPAQAPAQNASAAVQPAGDTSRPSRRDSSAPTERPVPARFYSVQIAAYDSPESAQRVVAILHEQGIDARVDGTTRPFRVRIGRYGTRAEAAKAAATLKSQGHTGFITLVER